MTPRYHRFNAPTVKRILEHFPDLEPSQAGQIRAMILRKADPREVSPACDRWVRQCFNTPRIEEQILCAIDEILGTYGIEGWSSDTGRRGVTYCNTGDTYARTFALVPDWPDVAFLICDLEYLADYFGPESL